jgi:hypothetical protein
MVSDLLTPLKLVEISCSYEKSKLGTQPQPPQQIEYPFHVKIAEDNKGLAKVTVSVRSFIDADDAGRQCIELFISTKNALKARGVKVAE